MRNRIPLMVVALVSLIAPASLAETLTVMTWNCEFLMHPDDVPAQVSLKITDLDAKLDALAEVIARHQPDILALQEVGIGRAEAEGQSMAPRLADRLRAQGLDYTAIVNPTADSNTRQHCAVLYRGFTQVGEPAWHADESTDLLYGAGNKTPTTIVAKRKLSKGLLDVALRHEASGHAVRVFVFHTLSNVMGWDADIKRAADARLIGRIVRGAAAGGEDVIACGDLNDDHNSPTFGWLVGSAGADDLEFPKARLRDLCVGIPRADDWTYEFGGYADRIDQVVGRFATRPQVLPSIDHEVPKVDWCGDAKPEPVSDHAPVIVRLEW